ncbi:peptidoglycan-binding protein [Novosphingobium sp. Gsoil 351]|uniref:peptidoglycan-binding protein n=1 Tax=Novosphingobium sp. Gsoil 351 TaxID=2675225 RepID=UPI0018A80BE4|nr:peptidoglycan-binding protein [Novosphingobium sp. Gsoil 351]
MGEARMRAGRFLVASLVTAGFGDVSLAQERLVGIATGSDPGANESLLEQAYAREHLFTLAGHRSHSSHSSHSSHRSSYGGTGHSSHVSHTSHRSSTGGGGYDYVAPPAAVYTSPQTTTAPRRSQPSVPYEDTGSSSSNTQRYGFISPSNDESRSSGLKPLTGRSERFRMIVCRVQLALAARDFYSGAIDCTVGPKLRGALRRFQDSHKLNGTGTITPEVLDALMVSTD